MEDTITLLRTVVRTFFPNPRQILAVDALIHHKVLHLEDLVILLSSQSKELRGSLTPLRTARILSTGTKAEYRIGQNPPRSVQREYFYIDYRQAIDAIKYKIMKLRKRVQEMYAMDEVKRKDWRCPRCKAEYDELEVMDKVNDDGFYCDRCGATLVVNEAAQRDRGSHEKIRRLNDQLSRFEGLISNIDARSSGLPHSEGLFEKLYTQRIRVPRPDGNDLGQYVEADKVKGKEKRLDEVKVENLQVNLTSGAEHDREEAERAEQRRREIAKQNQLPVWHTQSAIGMASARDTGVKAEDVNGVDFLKKEEEDEKKSGILTAGDMQDEVAKYYAEMEREREEAERAREMSEEEETDDEDEFEDVVGTNVGTPMSSQNIGGKGPTSASAVVNGVKRELDEESSEAETPASLPMEREVKRVKVEDGSGKFEVNGTGGVPVKLENHVDADSDEDEDFEDAM